MDENKNRKVLISIKVSTIVEILFGIILLIIIINLLSNKFASNKKVANRNIEIEENLVNVSNENSALSYRSSMPRTEEKDEEIELKEEIPVIVSKEVTGEIVHEIEEPVIEEVIIPTTKIEDVTISKDMDLTVRTGLSRDDFILLMSEVKADTSNFFEENAGLIYDMCEKYQINEIFFCGLISAESGWNIAANHRRTFNYISLMSSNGLIKFASVEDGIEKAAIALHDNYLTIGGRFYYGPTLSGVKTKFCPASSTWIDLVYGRMKEIIK